LQGCARDNRPHLLGRTLWDKTEIDDLAGLAFLDRLAGRTSGDVPDFETVRNLYQSDARLHMDGVVHSYGGSGLETLQIPS